MNESSALLTQIFIFLRPAGINNHWKLVFKESSQIRSWFLSHSRGTIIGYTRGNLTRFVYLLRLSEGVFDNYFLGILLYGGVQK